MQLAIHNLWVFNPTSIGKFFPKFLVHLVLLISFTAVAEVLGAPAGPTDASSVAQQRFREAEARYARQSTNTEAAWQFARACFDLAEFATNTMARADIAEKGIAACRQALSWKPKFAAVHYYLGMNLAQLARTKGLGALKIVDEMEHEFSIARELDANLDYGGPDRNLGLLYRDTPSVISIGNHSKAKQHLHRAVELAPDYPENRLNLIEADLKWNDRNGARREMKALEERWPAAHTTFSGQVWAATWSDWEQRFKAVKKKIEEPAKSLQTPRQTQ